jgi:nitrilase
VSEPTKETTVLKEYPKFTAAAVQASPEYRDKPQYFDSAATLNNVLDRIKEAASNGARLIVFPELHIPGYCHFAIDLTKGPEYTSIWAEYLRHGIEVPSEETDLLCTAARQANANVVVGINERDKNYAGRQYNSILFISNLGEILGVHRKINITVQELMIHTRGDGGHNLRVHDMDFGRVSGLICGEHDQPLLKQYYIVQGTKVNCSLWPGYLGGAEELPWVTPAMTTAMAVSGACWCVLAANYIPPEKRPTDFYPNTDFYQSFGGSAIINPFGEVVAGPVRDEETIVYADIDLKLNEMARGIINITGLYSRWDILSLLVRENDYEPAISMESLETHPMGISATTDATPEPIAARSTEVDELRNRICELEKELETLRVLGR